MVLVAGLAAACSDPDTGAPAAGPGPGDLSTVRRDADVAALVPAATRRKGRLAIGTNAPNPPIVFYRSDNKTLTGYAIDLGDAIGRVMGLRTMWKNASFDAVLPGLAAGRYDAAMSSFSVEPERLQSADFVSYYLSGGGFLVKRGSGIAVNSFHELCGYRVGVKKGASQIDALKEASSFCTRHHRDGVTVLQVPDETSMTLALISGRADVAVDDKPQALYAARRSQDKICVSSVYQTSHSIAGIAIPKGSPLARPMQAAVDRLLANGVYDRIARAWDAGADGSGPGLTRPYQKVAAAWGVGSDGRLKRSKIFTEPDQISDESTYYYQPVRKGCA